MTILDRIVEHKRREVEERRKKRPITGTDRPVDTPRRSLGAALRRIGGGISVIAEFKKASPSKGVIRRGAAPVEVASIYERHGASAISTLTDAHFFQGSSDDLTVIRASVSLPVLRKDFIIDPYQIAESAFIGADAILLIVAILTDSELREYQDTARSYGLSCLVETHTGEEVERALRADAAIIGVNNRNLADFTVDLNRSLALKERIPPEVMTVSESGIHRRDDVLRLQDAGFDAILVGESLMAAPDIGHQFDTLLGRAHRP